MKPKILIIDDEIHIVELIRFNLETSGYEVDIAGDGVEALAIFIDGKYVDKVYMSILEHEFSSDSNNVII